MSTPSDTFEDQLREQLHTTTPGPYAGLDPVAVIGAGERVVRRRRLGTALVAAVVVAAVALGASALGGGRPTAEPVPAGPSGTAGTGTAHLKIAQNGKSERGYTVTLLPDPDQPGQLRETWRQDGVEGTVGSSVDQSSRRATWGFGGDSPFVLGLVPDEAARSVSMSAKGDFGGYASSVEPVLGTGWSAFVLAYERPLTGSDPFAAMLWIDHLGRPVDRDGNVGAVTTVAGRQVYLTRDGATLGVDDGNGATAATPMPGTPDFGRFGAYPRVTMSRGEAGPTTAWTVAIRLRPEAVTATLVLKDGRRVAVTPVRLGNWAVAVAPKIVGRAAPVLTRVEWATAAGVRHGDPLTGG
ncbi:MAG: hypothetical protein M3Y71_04340 [Actinomycetota bacterium]|nr:hypothetical protein [Actinomycetota bacterium]